MKATGVTAGLVESNGSLLPGLWRDSLHVTCGLTACTPGSAPGQTLGNEYGKTLLYLFYITDGWTPYCYIDPALDISVPTIIQSQDVSIVSNTHMQYDAFHHATLIRVVAGHCHRHILDRLYQRRPKNYCQVPSIHLRKYRRSRSKQQPRKYL